MEHKKLSSLQLPVLLLLSLLLLGFFYLTLLSWKCPSILLEFNLFSFYSAEFLFSLVIDKVSLSFSLVVSIISFSVFYFATYYMAEEVYFTRFMWVLFLFVLSMDTLIFSGSLFTMLLGWDGLGLSSFALIIYYPSQDSLKAGYLTLLINRFGDSVIIMTMFVFIMLGQFSILAISTEMFWVVVLLGLGSITKSAQYPFCSWLPAAMAAPTPVSALVHSSTLVTAGVYLLVRLSINHPLPGLVTTPLMLLSALTCFLGGSAAMFENDLKKIIALSTLSQLGVMMFSLSNNMTDLALFHLYTHAMFKALLFIAAGSILMMSLGTQDIRVLGGILKNSPLTALFFVVSSLCLAGMPFTSSFYTKHIIFENMVTSSTVPLASSFLMLLGSLATVVYSMRLMKVVFSSPTLMCMTLAPQGSLYYYTPLIFLGMMSVLSGKLFTALSLSYNEFCFIPAYCSASYNILLWGGLILGLFIWKSMPSYLFSSLFFLQPVFSNFNKVLPNISLMAKSLDYGWLEPNFLLKSSFPMGFSKLLSYFLWPNYRSASLLKPVMVMIILWTLFVFDAYD